MKLRVIVVAAAIVVLCACGGGPPQAPAPDTTTAPSRKPVQADSPRAGAPDIAQTWTDTSWGFEIDIPRGWSVRRDFAHGYLANDSWKTYAAPDSRGTAIVSLTLPGSDAIASAEIRIGASRDANEVAQCTTPPDSLRSGGSDHESIGGVDFAAFDAADAAMSHYLDVHGHRAVHEGACYAIDLLVYGTDPGVYDPPAQPPFSRQQAFARMTAVLRTFRFTR